METQISSFDCNAESELVYFNSNEKCLTILNLKELLVESQETNEVKTVTRQAEDPVFAVRRVVIRSNFV